MGDRFAAPPQARPRDRRHDQLGNFQTVLLGRITPASTASLVYLDGIVLKRSWAGEVRNVSLLVAIGVNSEGYREILGICEGAKEDKAGWSSFLKYFKERGLVGVRPDRLISDACLGLAESAVEFFPDAA